ncbi:hypothetical protein L7F22_045707 [Adiantum nelumboides]|nr:hypothetical protein [Adiantum nelumboides]
MNSCDVVLPANFQEGGKQCFWERTEATLRELQEAGHRPCFKAWKVISGTTLLASHPLHGHACSMTGARGKRKVHEDRSQRQGRRPNNTDVQQQWSRDSNLGVKRIAVERKLVTQQQGLPAQSQYQDKEFPENFEDQESSQGLIHQDHWKMTEMDWEGEIGRKVGQVLSVHGVEDSHGTGNMELGCQFVWMPDDQSMNKWLQEAVAQPNYTDMKLVNGYDLSNGRIAKVLRKVLKKPGRGQERTIKEVVCQVRKMPRNSQEEARKARARKDKEKPRSGQEKARKARTKKKTGRGQERTIEEVVCQARKMPIISQEEARTARAKKDKEKPRSGQEAVAQPDFTDLELLNRPRRARKRLGRGQEGQGQESPGGPGPGLDSRPSLVFGSALNPNVQIQPCELRFQICKGQARNQESMGEGGRTREKEYWMGRMPNGYQDGMFRENALVQGRLLERRKRMVGRAGPCEQVAG